MRLNKMKYVLFFLIVIAGNSFAETEIERLDTAYNAVDKGYPRVRYIDGGTSLLFGSMAILTGISATNKNNYYATEKSTGYALIGIGFARVVDSIILFSSMSRIEQNMNRYRDLPQSSNSEISNKISFGKSSLSANFRQSERMRKIRSYLIAGTALGYLNLYSTGRKEYQVKGYIGFFLLGLATWKYLSPYPEEKAWKKYNKESQTVSLISSFYILPEKDGLLMGLNMSF